MEKNDGQNDGESKTVGQPALGEELEKEDEVGQGSHKESINGEGNGEVNEGNGEGNGDGNGESMHGETKQRSKEVDAAMKNFTGSSEPKWKKNRDTIDHKTRVWAGWAGFWGIAGWCCAIGQNELILEGGDPKAPVQEVLKGANLAVTLLSAYCIWETNKLEVMPNIGGRALCAARN
eukprot:2992120-Rhodomonas_salina.2